MELVHNFAHVNNISASLLYRVPTYMRVSIGDSDIVVA